MSRRLKFSAILMFCMLALSVLSVHTVHAANTNKKTLTVTIDEKNPFYNCEFKLTKSSGVKAEIKILGMSGKGQNKKIYWGAYRMEGVGKGSLFYDLNPSKLKKNKTLKSTELNSHTIRGAITFNLPEGITKLKIKVTVSTEDGKKSLKSFKRVKTIKPF